MTSSVVKGLILLLMLCSSIAAEEIEEGPDESCGCGCANSRKRINKQITILNRISNSSEELALDVDEIKARVVKDIPTQLTQHSVALDALQISVGTDIPAIVVKQSLELKGIKASIDAIIISLNKHSEDFLVHDARLKEQGLLLEKINSSVSELHTNPVKPVQPVQPVQPKDCSDIRALGHSVSGIYRIYPGSSTKPTPADVYCDMTTPGGNWLVFQRRKDGSVNFELTWLEYQNGFGNPSGEFWLGNELLHLLTSNRKYKLRIDLEDFDGQKRYAEYSTFSIGSAADKYKLTVGRYTGNAGDSLSQHNGMKFSTKDADNDVYGVGSCSLLYRGAWWYYQCISSGLNGLYFRGGLQKSIADGIYWYSFRGHYYSLKTSEMKIAVAN